MMSRIVVELHYCDLNASSLLKSWRTPSLIDKKKMENALTGVLESFSNEDQLFQEAFPLFDCLLNIFSKDAAP